MNAAKEMGYKVGDSVILAVPESYFPGTGIWSGTLSSPSARDKPLKLAAGRIVSLTDQETLIDISCASNPNEGHTMWHKAGEKGVFINPWFVDYINEGDERLKRLGKGLRVFWDDKGNIVQLETYVLQSE